MNNPANSKRKSNGCWWRISCSKPVRRKSRTTWPLFGPGSLGLDSVDALQIVVALDKNYGLKIPNPEAAKTILQSVNTIEAALEEHLSVKPR